MLYLNHLLHPGDELFYQSECTGSIERWHELNNSFFKGGMCTRGMFLESAANYAF